MNAKNAKRWLKKIADSNDENLTKEKKVAGYLYKLVNPSATMNKDQQEVVMSHIAKIANSAPIFWISEAFPMVACINTFKQ